MNNFKISHFDQTWKQKYIHTDYYKHLDADFKALEPCVDVFLVPLMSEVFCNHLIEEMEHYGKWSGGKPEVSE